MKTGTHSEKLSGIPARGARQAFTLIELLVVIAITAILITLIFKPLLDAYNLTSRAGTQIESQAEARKVLSFVTAALGNAVFVYDNALDEAQVNIWAPARNGGQVKVPMRYVMVEYVSPGRTSDQKPPAGTPIDPTTGEPVYAAGGVGSGFSLPLAPGRVLGRIFPGLRNNASNAGQPNVPYGNNFEEPGRVNSTATNRYMLYDARVMAYIPDPAAPAQYIPNLRLFHTGTDPRNPTDRKTDALLLHDPNFFYDSSVAGGNEPNAGDPAVWAEPGWIDLNGDNRVQICENWRAVSNPLLPVGKADVISFDRSPDRQQRNALRYNTLDANQDETNVPCNADGSPCGTRPLITFEPTLIVNDPGVVASTESIGGETGTVVGSAFKSQYGYWSGPARVLVYRRRLPENLDGDPTNDVEEDPTSGTNLALYAWVVGSSDKAAKITDISGRAAGTDLPSIETMAQDDANYPDIGPATRGFLKPNGARFAFDVDRRRGIVNFAIPSWVTTLGHADDAERRPSPPAPATVVQGAAQRYAPADINLRLSVLNGTGKRYIWLAEPLSTNTWPDPFGTARLLNPTGSNSLLNQYLTLPDNSPLPLNAVHPMRVVPGAERVYGPDQRPGPNYGHRILYTRVSSTAGVIGKNEYKINYENVPNAIAAATGDPRVRAGFIEFDSTKDTSSLDNLPDVGPGNVPIVPGVAFIGGDGTVFEDPITGRFRPHGLPHMKVIDLGGTPTRRAADPVEVYYSAQMNRPGDVVKMDYRTRELLTVNIGVRLYDPRTSTQQNVSVSGKIKVRNLQP